MLRGLRLGEMDVKIIIQSATTVKDAATNEPEETWADLKTVWAKEMKAPSSKEGYEANQQVAVSEVQWMIRRDTTITEQMRINKNSVYYYISGIEDFGRQGFMILTAEKRDNE
jgi:SPP1 family predicted phage head-tail adaptor